MRYQKAKVVHVISREGGEPPRELPWAEVYLKGTPTWWQRQSTNYIANGDGEEARRLVDGLERGDQVTIVLRPDGPRVKIGKEVISYLRCSSDDEGLVSLLDQRLRNEEEQRSRGID